MTRFEASVIMFMVTAIVFVIVVGINMIVNRLNKIIDNQYANWEQLRKIETHTNFLADISQQLDNIEDNILDDLRDIRLADKLGKTSPNVPITPCYAPDGICTNPCMDCINCPKRGTGGTWSTSTNLNKED